MMYANRTESGKGDARISIKVAVYPENGVPEVSEVSAASTGAAVVKFSRLISEKVRAFEGAVPEEAVREVIENLIHADFEGVVVSVLKGGNVVRVSDKGPGIDQKGRAFEFGFSGATPEALGEIRGVGAGLGIARAAAEKAGGTVSVEDNIGGGTVVTVTSGKAVARRPEAGEQTGKPAPQTRYPDAVPRINLSGRQQKVLIMVLESGEVGPSTVAEMLEISVSTAYRDLSFLEENGLLTSAESGKRIVTPLGRDVVATIINAWMK